MTNKDEAGISYDGHTLILLESEWQTRVSLIILTPECQHCSRAKWPHSVENDRANSSWKMAVHPDYSRLQGGCVLHFSDSWKPWSYSRIRRWGFALSADSDPITGTWRRACLSGKDSKCGKVKKWTEKTPTQITISAFLAKKCYKFSRASLLPPGQNFLMKILFIGTIFLLTSSKLLIFLS